MYALAAGDLDGDGRIDLAFTGTPDGLSVLFQDKDGGFDRQRVFDIADPAGLRGTVVASDLNGDGRTDLVVLTKIAASALSPVGRRRARRSRNLATFRRLLRP